MPRWVVANEDQDEASTSEEESTDQEGEGDEEDEEAAAPSRVEPDAEAEPQAPGSAKKREKISIPLGKLVCHVRSYSGLALYLLRHAQHTIAYLS